MLIIFILFLSLNMSNQNNLYSRYGSIVNPNARAIVQNVGNSDSSTSKIINFDDGKLKLGYYEDSENAYGYVKLATDVNPSIKISDENIVLNKNVQIMGNIDCPTITTINETLTTHNHNEQYAPKEHTHNISEIISLNTTLTTLDEGLQTKLSTTTVNKPPTSHYELSEPIETDIGSISNLCIIDGVYYITTCDTTNKLYYSTDLVSWNYYELPETVFNILSIYKIGTVYVIIYTNVNNFVKAIWTENITTWNEDNIVTVRTFETSSQKTAKVVRIGDTIYVYNLDIPIIVYTTNGKTWNTYNVDDYISTIYSYNDLFYIYVNDIHKLYISDNIQSYHSGTCVQLYDGEYDNDDSRIPTIVCCANGKHYAINNIRTTIPVISYSPDGIDWKFIYLPTNVIKYDYYCLSTVIFINGFYILPSYNMLGNDPHTYWISYDGENWEQHVSDNVVDWYNAILDNSHNRLISIPYPNSSKTKLVTFTTSTVNSQETYRQISETFAASNITHDNNDRLTKVEETLDNAGLPINISKPTEKYTWEIKLPAVHKANNSDFVRGGTAGEDNVIVCYGATGVYTITNRDSSVYTTVNANCAFTKVEYGNGVFVGISSTKAPTAGGIVFSRDGITWVYVNANSFFGSNPGTNDKYSDIVYGNDRFVIAGYNGVGSYIWYAVIDTYDTNNASLITGYRTSADDDPKCPWYADGSKCVKVNYSNRTKLFYVFCANGKFYYSDGDPTNNWVYGGNAYMYTSNDWPCYYANGRYITTYGQPDEYYDEGLETYVETGTYSYSLMRCSNENVLDDPTEDKEGRWVIIPGESIHESNLGLTYFTVYEPLHFKAEVFVFINQYNNVYFVDNMCNVLELPEYPNPLPFKPKAVVNDGTGLVFIDEWGNMAWSNKIKISTLSAKQIISPMTTYRGMAYGNGKYVVVGSDADNRGCMLVSEDGITWTHNPIMSVPSLSRIFYNPYEKNFLMIATSPKLYTTSIYFKFRPDMTHIYKLLNDLMFIVRGIDYNPGNMQYILYDTVAIHSINSNENTIASSALPSGVSGHSFKTTTIVNDNFIYFNDVGDYMMYNNGAFTGLAITVPETNPGHSSKAFVISKNNVLITVYSYSNTIVVYNWDTSQKKPIESFRYTNGPFYNYQILTIISANHHNIRNPEEYIPEAYLAIAEYSPIMFYSTNGLQWHKITCPSYITTLTSSGCFGIDGFTVIGKDADNNFYSIYTEYNKITNDNIMSPIELKILQHIYPVGSIYTSMNDINPAELFGFGIWERIIDRFLYCSIGSGATGGSKTHTHTYGLQVAGFYTSIKGLDNGDTIRLYDNGKWTKTGGIGVNTSIKYDNTNGTAGTAAIQQGLVKTSETSTLPPYLTVYGWQRVK